MNYEATTSVECPYCGESLAISVDTSVPTQQLTLDCEVCCRPMEITVECEPGEILSAQAVS